MPLWEASDRLCGKRLQALLPLLVESLESHGHLNLEPELRESLLTMSSATIDRLLGRIRKLIRARAIRGLASAMTTAAIAPGCRDRRRFRQR